MNTLQKKTIITLVILVMLFANFVMPRSVAAQGNQPGWMDNLKCDDPKYQGVTYCQDTISNDNGTTTKVHIIGVDLKSPGIRFEYIIASGKNHNGNIGECQDVNRTAKGKIGCDDPGNPAYYPLIPWKEATSRFNDTAVVVTSDYGAGDQNVAKDSREHGPEGLTIVNGNRLDGKEMNDQDNNAVARPWLAISNPPSLNVIINQLSQDNGKKPYDWIYTALGGAPWMIRNGKVTTEEINNCYQKTNSCYSKAAQVAVGLSQDKRWLFLVVGQTPEPALEKPPTPLLNLASFMQGKLGIYQAFKLDGGGSTKFWYGGNDVYINSNRQLSQYLGVIAEPVEEQPKPAPGPNWWQQISDWWEKLTKSTANKLQQWWEAQQRKLADWLEQQLIERLNALCGSAWLPGIAVAGIWMLKRHRPNKQKG